MAIPAISRLKILKVCQKVRQEVHHEVCHFIFFYFFILIHFSGNNNSVSPAAALSHGRIHYLLEIV